MQLGLKYQRHFKENWKVLIMSLIYEMKEKAKSLSLLYVEDEPSSREQVGTIFKLFFTSMTVAQDGEEGWEYYQNGTFDLVVTDINMPRMNGIELTQKIKNLNPMQKVVIVSAHDSGEYLFAAIRAGVDDFILKPVEMNQFEMVINKVITEILNAKLRQFYQEKLEEEVVEKTQELVHQALTDDLTGLFNRKKLNLKLNKSGKKILMLLNIDNFDNINATYGYSRGDLIMKKIAHFLRDNLHPKGSIFRLGHDEFVFLFTSIKLSEVKEYAKTLQHLISQQPITYDEIVVKFTATIVLAEGETNLLRNVHIAFKETRALGKNRIGEYHHDSNFEIHQKKIFETMYILRSALENDEIIPYFQPIVDNLTSKVKKFECLARIHRHNEILSPAQFIEAAEVSGLLPEITRIMIEKSFKYFSNREESFSINISEHDLNDFYLIEYLQTMAKKYAISPSRVVLEVLEGVSVTGAQKSLEQLITLKGLGFQLAIDDFGAQNSNFERVHLLKVDFIKIDGSFIKQIDTNMNSYHIAKTITDFSKNVGAKVIAEYVHSESVHKKVMELGIDFSQGYYFAQPSPEIKGV